MVRNNTTAESNEFISLEIWGKQINTGQTRP